MSELIKKIEETLERKAVREYDNLLEHMEANIRIATRMSGSEDRDRQMFSELNDVMDRYKDYALKRMVKYSMGDFLSQVTKMDVLVNGLMKEESK